MPTIKKKSKTDWLVGQWRASVGSCLFVIGKTANGFRVQCFDESDGEELIVSKMKWNGKVLCFNTLTPSNKWRTRNCLKVISKTKAIHELTNWNPWKKILPETKRKGHRKSKIDWLVGRWQNCDGCIDVVFIVDKTANGFRVQAFEECDGEELVVSKVKWDGKVLSFDTITPSNKWRTRNRLKVISKTKAIHELTFWESWKKCKPTATARTRAYLNSTRQP